MYDENPGGIDFGSRIARGSSYRESTEFFLSVSSATEFGKAVADYI